MSEKFHLKDSLVNERFSAGEGPVTVSGSVTAGEIETEAEFDPEHLTAEARAEATTVRVETDAQAETPAGTAEVHGDASGPSAHAGAEASPDGIGAGFGASAGEAGAGGGVDVLGDRYEAGFEIGAKAEFGVHLGASSEIKLPIGSLKGPTPNVKAVLWAGEAAANLATDPIGTAEGALDDARAAAEEALKAGGEVLDTAEGLLGGGEPDDHAVTTDEFGGPKAPPGSKPID